jgi:hypothetical protein
MPGIDAYTFYWGRIILSAIAGAVCCICLYKTDGKHGMGWFLALLLLIWI